MTQIHIKRCIFLSICMLCMIVARGYNIRQTTISDGLSSSAVLSMAQDSDGFLWLGTLDGVNITDGSATVPFSVLYPGVSLSGNLIENIIAAPDGNMWIHTNHGLDRFNRSTVALSSYPQFNGQEKIGLADNGDLLVLGTDDKLYYLPAGSDSDFI